MVVAPLTLTCLALATLFVAALPILLYRRYRTPLALDRRDAIAGIAAFAFFAMVVERALNAFVLQQNEATATLLANPVSFVIYGAFAAGICEETGRFIAMRLLLKRALKNGSPSARTNGTALSYGIGHGGAEAWLVGVLVQIQWIVFAIFENRGELALHLSNVPAESMMRIHLVLAGLSPATAGIFAVERVAALVFQIALSVLMWRGVRAGWKWILPLAIVAHAAVDLPAALFQARLLPLVAVDGIYVVVALGVAAMLVKLFRRPSRPVQSTETSSQ
ncbi:YhfC family intramembrane metalloprotease [Paraburkholderia saeva]|uniref:YhfC family intramembrane metalloprotease n=1 Tax=Paraburkholderia saeva TaxID=2777537 RepID=A0A9N8X453_9BURK|nr:YhfC family intramembrane metalloprotease [Paraburkholderia saeva]CAG4921390.1 hypothetical protein LMG31841_05082 [Paraburkholderia saeva]